MNQHVCSAFETISEIPSDGLVVPRACLQMHLYTICGTVGIILFRGRAAKAARHRHQKVQHNANFSDFLPDMLWSELCAPHPTRLFSRFPLRVQSHRYAARLMCPMWSWHAD